MMKRILFILICVFSAMNLACSSAPVANSETNKVVVTNTNSANLPEGFAANQVPVSADSTPGIPDPKSANANSNSKPESSIPGIPDQTKTGKTPAPGKTPPIPGIPDEETLKKQMNTPADRRIMDQKLPQTNSNSASRPNSKRSPGGNSNTNR